MISGTYRQLQNYRRPSIKNEWKNKQKMTCINEQDGQLLLLYSLVCLFSNKLNEIPVSKLLALHREASANVGDACTYSHDVFFSGVRRSV